MQCATLWTVDALRLPECNEGVFVESARGCPTTGCRGYELLQNLDFDNPLHYQSGRVNIAWTSGAGWQPVGTQRYPFTARFKGNGYTIANLRVNRPDSDSGLFGAIDGSKTDVAIEGLGLTNVDIVGGAHAGGLVGYNRAGDISQSYVTGSVVARGNGTSAIVGGLVGHNRSGDISQSYVAGSVSALGNATSLIVGGLVGHNRAGDISQSYVTGSVSALGNGTSLIVGGLVGRNIRGSITESYSETQVKGNVSDRLKALTGGLVALNDDRSRIENSYAIGSVIAQDRVGGLVASNRNSSEIINSYAVSRAIAVGARSRAGGLVARNDATVSDSYWDIEASGVASSAGGTSATTIILQSSTPTSPISLINGGIYRNWDADVWEFADANRYPALKAVNNAHLLARGGKSLLQSLTVSGARLFPSFHPLIFDYDIIAESGQMTEVQLNTTSTTGTTIDVVCSDGLTCSPGIPTSFVLDGSHTPKITINTRTLDDGVLPYNLSVRHVESEISQLVLRSAVTVSMPLTVAEGENVRLLASHSFGLHQDPPRYSWRQLAGDVLKFNDPRSPVDTQNASLDFTVPSDVVSGQDDRHTVQLISEIAVNDDVYLSTTISLIISKRDNDAADRVRLLRDNNEAHTYSIRIEREDGSEFVDRDGGFASTHIEWQRRRGDAESWVNVGSESLYTLPNEGDYQYRVLAVYEDQQGYRQQLASEIINYLDIDDDNDGLIEIHYLEELDAMRYVLDGSGYKADAMSTTNTTGCAIGGCKGFELMNDLDFADDASYRTPNPSTLKSQWTVSNFTDASDSSWQPIGEVFDAVFNGNGYTISNMQINRSVGYQNHIGLFSQIGATGKVKNLGLVDSAIKGLAGIKNVGGIAGSMQRGGVIMNSYVIGDVTAGNTNRIIRGDVGFVSGRGFIGGMVGWNKGVILNSYTKINVVAEDSATLSNKLVGVGGLVGRNIDGGKVYNSYATGEVKGPCTVGGLVGNQFSTDSDELLKRSEIKNSYTTGNVETGFGTCSNSDNQIAGGLVGRNNNSKVENSYVIGKVSGVGTLSGLVGKLSSGSAIENPVNSYWNYNANCSGPHSQFDSENNFVRFVSCYNRDTPAMIDSSARLGSALQISTMPNANNMACVNNMGEESSCRTYVDWNTDNWYFGTIVQYPTLKYGVGLDTNNPGCDKNPNTELTSCDALLPGQVADALLLESLSLSFNSQNVRLTPSFAANRFNYVATIANEAVPAVIQIATDAATDTSITIRKDGGAPLPKRTDGTVQISASDSFHIGVETARGNERGANYQIRVNLKRAPLPLPDIRAVVNGAAPTDLAKQSILILNEADVMRLDIVWGSLIGRGLSIRWSQVSGKLLTRSIPTIEFTVPVDFVARDEDDSTVVLKLELSDNNNPVTAASREIPILVRKVDNGNSESGVKWISSDTLLADDLSDDIDGGILGDIGYQWSRKQNGVFVAIPDANQKSYTAPRYARNAQYRLSISYTDAQGYDTNIHYDAPLYKVITNFVDKDGDGLIEIETLEDLDAIRYQLDGSGYRTTSGAVQMTAGCPTDGCSGYELTRNLDFMDDNSYRLATNKARYLVTTATDVGWQPIGDTSMPFGGTFDGNGYTIANLMINRGSTRFVGLFGYTRTAAEIANLGLLDVDVSGQSRVGSLVGRNDGTITNSYAIGTVSGRFEIGGLVGENDGGSITNSHAMGTVSGRFNIGGLVGENDGGSITNSYAIAEVKGSTSGVGGLAGRNDDGSIMNSYATGSVDGEEDVGGLIGSNDNGGNIENSYATGDVSGRTNASNLVGSNTGSITNSYAIGDVTAIGRLSSGLVAITSNEINHSYWLSGSAVLGGINITSGIPIDAEKTAEELKSPTQPGTTSTDVYYSWDATVWDFGTAEEYPALKYHDHTCSTAMPSPDCGKLLLHQRIGLRDLKLEQNVGAGHLHLSPDFDTAVTTYTMSVHANASELRIIPIAVNPDAIIVADGKVLSADNFGYTLALNPSGPTSTIISVAASNSIATEKPIVYKLTVNNRLPSISINAPASIVEGETLAFSATIEDPDGDELSYSLTTIPNLFPKIEGSTGTVVGRADLRYELNIPSTLLDEMQSTVNVDVVLTVDNGSSVESETAQLTIVKENNGVISIPAPTLDRFTYTIAGIDLSLDTDGANPTPEIAYQWQKELLGSWSDIDGATDASHTVAGIIGDRYRVLFDYTDKQGYRHHNLVSPTVLAPQQFVYNMEKSRSVVRETMDQPSKILIRIRVFLEGALQ